MTYEAWRITFQSNEQAARAAFYRCAELAAEVRRLQSEVERLPARRAQPTVKTAPIGPTKHKKWGIIGIIDETDDEFAARSGWKVVEVAR